MAYIRPFQGIRPRRGLEDSIAALPYDVYNRQEAKAEVEGEPMSFLKIDRAETQFDDSVDMYDARVYQKAHDILWGMIKQGEFVQDTKPCYYVYQLIMDGRAQTGLVACASVDDYRNNVIKKHENTRADKEEDRIRHVDICKAQTGPIFLAYRSNAVINQNMKKIMQESPLYDFTAKDGITHRVWLIDEAGTVQAIQNAFEGIRDIYIADGHHRCASAVKVSLKRRAENPDFTGEEEFNFFLSVLFPNDQLMIMDYNRVVKDLNGYSAEQFKTELTAKFEIEEKGTEPYQPERKGIIAMYLEKRWYKLTVKSAIKSLDPVKALDVSILQNEILEPLLGIDDPKTDKRVDFVGGIRGLKELERRVETDSAVAFAMYPTSIQELFAVSDADLLMPPKSTWFEPKLRSGLFIHSI